jgi:uncharacterized protein (DUF58 family)
MIPKEILQKVKRIELKTRGLVNDLFGGEYHSAFKGRGMTFSEVREYHPGDDIRLIDWNVTARSNAPFIKIFEEERELTVYLIVDISSSGQFGSKNKLKQEIGAEIAAVLGFSAIKNNDKVGLILFSDIIEKYLVPKKGKSHVFRLIKEVLNFNPENQKTSINVALDYLLKVTKRKSVVFFISDFIDNGFWEALKVANRKHDLIAVHLYDKAEYELPNLGLVKILDPESQETAWIDTSNPFYRSAQASEAKNKRDKLLKNSKKIGLDIISISTDEDYVDPLLSFFKKREKRL